MLPIFIFSDPPAGAARKIAKQNCCQSPATKMDPLD